MPHSMLNLFSESQVLLKDKAFRVAKPKDIKGPQVKWGDDPGKAWISIKEKMLDYFIERKMELPVTK